MIPMEWFLLNVDVVGEEDTVNFYELSAQSEKKRLCARPSVQTKACYA